MRSRPQSRQRCDVPAQRRRAAPDQVGKRLHLRAGQVPAMPLKELGSALVDHVRHAPRRPLGSDRHGWPSAAKASGTAIRSSRLGVFARCRRLTCR